MEVRMWRWSLLAAGCSTPLLDGGSATPLQAALVSAGTVGPYRWVDAEGTPVTEGSELVVWIDDLLWAVNVDTGEPNPGPYAALQRHLCGDDQEEWLTPAWGDAPYLTPVVPRRPYVVTSGDFFGLNVVRPDTLQPQVAPGDCSFAGYRPGDLQVVETPEVTWVPPLHPEPLP